jgi:putative ABC transport system permease protein
MIINSLKTALISLWGNKVRAVLNLLGVMIGVFAVTVLVSLGQGLKDNISGMIQGFGTNVVFVTSGKIDTKNPGGASGQVNPANFVTGDILTQNDVKSLEKLDHISAVAPMSLVSGILKNGEKTSTTTIFGSTPNILDAKFFHIQSFAIFFCANTYSHCSEHILYFFIFIDSMLHCFFNIENFTP